jgi:catechol-2,3-dioxygenase
MIQRPQSSLSLRHVALFAQKFSETVHFYQNILGMTLEWEPDEDNVYLTSGSDNLAIHRMKKNFTWPLEQRLDHIGFFLKTIEEVDLWYNFLKSHQVPIKAAPRTHRDGARSFYCLDPEGNAVQMIYHPPIAAKL